LGSIEVVGSKDDNGTDDSSTEEVDCQTGELLLERCADVDTEEATNSVGEGESVGFEISVRLGGTISLALHGADLAVLLSEGSSDSTDFGAGAGSEDDTLGTTLCDGGRAVGDVDTVAGSGVVFEDFILVLSNGERLTSQHGLISLEVNSLNKSAPISKKPSVSVKHGYSPNISRDRISGLDFHKITGNDLNGGNYLGVSIAHNTSSGRRHGPQRVHGLLGRVLLEETDGDIETNDEGDDTTLNP